MSANYSLNFPNIGSVSVTKKRGMKSLRLKISPKGEVSVSAPFSVPRSMIESFVKTREDWIAEHKESYVNPIRNGMRFGNGTRLMIEEGASRNHSSVKDGVLFVKLVGLLNPNDADQTKYIETKIVSAMQTEAENILLPRLHELAVATGHSFNQAYIKRLISRWGSCDQQKNIILNVFLLQLDPRLRDYIMLHELTHTVHLHHGKDFWAHMDRLLPNVKSLKKALKQHHPRIEERL